jgi:hypothetical protein
MSLEMDAGVEAGHDDKMGMTTMKERRRPLTVVIAGLDPAIEAVTVAPSRGARMPGSKPGHDDKDERRSPLACRHSRT